MYQMTQNLSPETQHSLVAPEEQLWWRLGSWSSGRFWTHHLQIQRVGTNESCVHASWDGSLTPDPGPALVSYLPDDIADTLTGEHKLETR